MTHDPEPCREMFALLPQHLDLELPPEACRDVEQHMAGCPPCVGFAESLRRTAELCRGYKPAVMPEPISESARGELEVAWRKAREARG